MNATVWFPLLLGFYAFISAVGLYLLKASKEYISIGFVSGVFFYGAGFIIWLFILRLYPLSLAFPAAAGALILATQVAGIVFLNEQTNVTALAGIGFIFVGILLIHVTTVHK